VVIVMTVRETLAEEAGITLVRFVLYNQQAPDAFEAVASHL
jgi:O-acetyl-ADP-ribose deacetylase (regulator of RNase III)